MPSSGFGQMTGNPNIQSSGSFDKIETTFKTWVNGSPKGKHELWNAWHSIDYNGNARVSLAEIDKWVITAFPMLNNKPALMRAYKATVTREKDEYVHKMDFPVLLRNIVYFNKLWNVFEGIDADDDRRLTFPEFTHGLTILGMGGRGNNAQARQIFDQLDRNRGGIVLFDEFCRWVASVQCPVDSSIYDPTMMASKNPWQGANRQPMQALRGAGNQMMTPRGSRQYGGGFTPIKAPTPLGMPRGGVTGLGHKRDQVCLGVIRLDYDYPPAPGDIDCPQSFGYDVLYRVVPGLTFKMCQSGKMTPAVEAEFREAVDWFEMKGVTGITGDCGFMMYFQKLARQNTHKPVFMSSLAQLPAVTCAFNKDELIAVVTANGKSLHPMRALIKDECGVDPDEKRYVFVGCEDVPGFEAVALGDKVDVKKVTPGVVAKCKKVLAQHPRIRAFLFECTELPPYSDAVRAATGLPVYDAITGCDFFINGFKDNARFGINNWREQWDGQQDEYAFGANLGEDDLAKLVNKPGKMPLRPPGQGRP
jgi:Ca2+-binding EF-hand superfamily protein